MLSTMGMVLAKTDLGLAAHDAELTRRNIQLMINGIATALPNSG